MNCSVTLRGFRYSVYNRIARMVLHEKGVNYGVREIDPFGKNIPKDYLERHPFGRVPVLSHDSFDVFETTAITRYVNAAFDGPELLPRDPKALARVAQVTSIIDNYGYRPMVRQVFAQRVFGPAVGEASDEAEIRAGIDASHIVLAPLNNLAQEGHVLNGRAVTLADCHLAPMMAYFVGAPEGARALNEYTALADWWVKVSRRASLQETDPGLPVN